jgi:hypothetical protein
MPDLTAKRTLVKSPPELWEELSEIERLAKHLDAFGEIRITKLEPEHTVAWEGEHASGTVSIEPSGWGTKVTLTAEIPEAEPPPVEEPPVVEPPVEDPPVEEPPVEEPPVEEPPVEVPRVEHAPVQPTVVPPKPVAKRRRGFWAWLFRERTESVVAAPLVAPRSEPEPEPEPVLISAPAAVEPAPVVAEPEPPVAEPEPLPPPPELTEPEPTPEPEPAEAEDNGLGPKDARAALDDMLDALGSAHHRPFSRG